MQEQLVAFDSYFMELQNLKDENNEIEFLKNSERRHQIVEKAQKQLSIPEFQTKFEELNKETEVNLVIKQLLSMKLGNVQ